MSPQKLEAPNCSAASCSIAQPLFVAAFTFRSRNRSRKTANLRICTLKSLIKHLLIFRYLSNLWSILMAKPTLHCDIIILACQLLSGRARHDEPNHAFSSPSPFLPLPPCLSSRILRRLDICGRCVDPRRCSSWHRVLEGGCTSREV